ncbi:Protein of unknown function [Raineyella antarctica]|uniref:DUF3040 domain-containing protein n=1 Tax=Raineyella antarctica TaxID=1577474 RepID=A0A1G6GE14_9ACTN|nr:DUF3040 domain-containing protein [Raineyella antarctica]SDB80149.1 Protein of unknown function [Raineyella antarctica]
MALSEHEQRLLEQMEAAFAAEDPKLADTLSGGSGRRLETRLAVGAGLGFVLGIALLLVGIQTFWLLSILGFLVMLAATIVGLTAWQKKDGTTPPKPGRTKPPVGAHDRRFMGRFEDRWNRRQEGNGR